MKEKLYKIVRPYTEIERTIKLEEQIANGTANAVYVYGTFTSQRLAMERATQVHVSQPSAGYYVQEFSYSADVTPPASAAWERTEI